MFSRWVEPLWKKKFAAPYAHLVFGARQTGDQRGKEEPRSEECGVQSVEWVWFHFHKRSFSVFEPIEGVTVGW